MVKYTRFYFLSLLKGGSEPFGTLVSVEQSNVIFTLRFYCYFYFLTFLFKKKLKKRGGGIEGLREGYIFHLTSKSIWRSINYFSTWFMLNKFMTFSYRLFFRRIFSIGFDLYDLCEGVLLNEYNHTKFLERDLCYLAALERWYCSPAPEDCRVHQRCIASRAHEFHA